MRKVLALLLTIAMVFASFSMVSAETVSQAPVFSDMPDNWSTAALNAAVKNGLLVGYKESGKTLIKPSNPLTRAEMATVVNRAFGAVNSTKLDGVRDVLSDAWYANEISKAVQMKTFAKDTYMRPNDKITRQEAFAVLARAFKITSTDTAHKALDKFTDKSSIAAWALNDLCGMAEAGYINGSNNKLNPTANITRAEFAVVMDSLVKQYIDEPGTVTEVVAAGNVMVRVAGVTLSNVTIKGDLIIGDGVGEGDATLDSVKVEGRTVVRGGGVDSFIIRGNSNVGKIVVSKVDGEVRIAVEGNADVEIIYVDDGSDDVIVQGTIGTLEVASDNVVVTAREATITQSIISGNNASFVVEQGSTVSTVSVSGANTSISGQGTVKTVTVAAGGNNASITTPNTVTAVADNVEGVTAGGQQVPGGSTATNNSTGTGATVTTPSTGGGGGGGGSSVPTPAMSIESVTVNGTPITPAGIKYTIPTGADETNTAIDVTIDNVANASLYSAVITIKTGNSTVAYAQSSGIQGVFINALSAYNAVVFDDIANMLDRVGTVSEGWYLDDTGNKIDVDESDVTAFENAVRAMFDRMTDGEVYTVTLTLTPAGGSSDTLEFEIERDR